ncbi:hypothetical protein THAOC_28103 [Thalassiosira oceanica]|uniref:Uncharacterized protein n=1 Tax=Thalassiosira oceanica TaxID=159749 RepID=K0RK14_THAOC|nr:hypothetical protein THAOC_28103 [Thalassiosira oceanica]|eukprot:EJK52604.1 hypothetical protein THAOC_28103 [Thalassiosira oceanica]
MSTWRVEFVGDSGSGVTWRSRFHVDRTRQLNPHFQPAYRTIVIHRLSSHFFGTWRGTMPTIDGDGPPAPANELFDPTQLTQNELDAMDPAQSEGDRSSSTSDSDSDDDDDEDDDDDDDAVSEASSTRNARVQREAAARRRELTSDLDDDELEEPRPPSPVIPPRPPSPIVPRLPPPGQMSLVTSVESFYDDQSKVDPKKKCAGR